MKKLFFCLFSILVLTSFTTPECCEVQDLPEDVPLTAERIQNGNLGSQYPQMPVQAPSASIDDHIFYINSSHPDCVVQLVDVDDETVVYYETQVSSATSSVVLPSTYSGDYIIQILWGDWRFWGYIYLP